MILQQAIPRISVSFDKAACNQPNSPVTSCVIFCDAKQRQFHHFIVQTMIEDLLRNPRDHLSKMRPNLNLKFDHVSQVDRDQIFHNGYSILYRNPGYGPVMQWGYPGGVSMIDLMGIASVIKTFNYEFDNHMKVEIARTIQTASYLMIDRDELPRCRLMMHDRFHQISDLSRNLRLSISRDPIYTPPPTPHEDSFFEIHWQFSTSQSYTIYVDFENFELSYAVPQHLFDLFDSCFGPELTYRMHPIQEEL